MTDVVVVVEPQIRVVEVTAQPGHASLEVIADPETRLIEVIEPGPQGPKGNQGEKGEQGEQGPAGDLTREHQQNSAADVWTIDHDLGKRPSVTVIDSAGDEVEGAVSYPSLARVVVRFSAPFSGTAYLN